MQFTHISLEEMKNALPSWEMTEQHCHEAIFESRLSKFPYVVIRVFSSISKDTERTRAIGTDAIRICAVNLDTKQGWIRTQKILRVQGWKANLKNAIDNIKKQAIQRCNRESSRSVIRTSRQQQLVSSLWGNREPYAAFASTLRAQKERAANLCPSCDGVYSKKDLVNTFTNVVIQGWKFKCSHCKKVFIVIGDKK